MRIYSVLDAVRDDHHRILSLFNQVLTPSKDQKKRTDQYRDLRRELTVHTLFEEETVYPRVRGTSIFDFFAPLAATHHKIIDTYINRIDKLPVGSADWVKLVDKLRFESATHMMVEERELAAVLKGVPMKARSRAS
ncbi:MAG: hemerythrin domain-containing protein [Deltaproteobacteria bacterium]|nr:hemerythrin domain-containing protein [Deltaproteobacteria bacterium]MBI3295368.1 hemerythrin domain-containing protein [Deltaproteobacteria bacterium]